MSSGKSRSWTVGTIAGALLCWTLSAPVHAAFQTDFTLDKFNPDLFTDQLSLNYAYTGGSSELNVTGTNVLGTITDIDNAFTNILDMDFTLIANFTNDGSILSGGTLSIINRGTTVGPASIPVDAVLLSADIFDMAIDPLSVTDTSGTFFFRLNNMASDISGLVPGWDVDRLGQVILNGAFTSAPGWEAGNVGLISGGLDSTADTSVAPSPATLLLLSTGLGLIGVRLYRGRRPRPVPGSANG
jgi:hypothetical protein